MPENEVWDKLVSESGPGIREAGDVISGLIDRAGGLSVTTPEAQFPPWEAERLLEEIISGVERELEKLCGRYDYRQLLFLSRLCVGVPRSGPQTRTWGPSGCAARTPIVGCCGAGTEAWTTTIWASGKTASRSASCPNLSSGTWRNSTGWPNQWRIIDHQMFNFVWLVSQENGLPDPRLILRSGGAVGRDAGSRENWASVNLFAHRYRSRNSHLAWWAMGDAEEPEDEPYTLTYGYSPVVTDGPYGGGELFIPVPLRLGAMMEYGKRFRPIFEREDALGMPPEHLRAISRGLAHLVIDGAEDPELAPWVALTGTLPVPRDSLLGAPLKEAARGYLADADPDRADDTDLEQSVERFVALASSSPDAVPGHRPGYRGSSGSDTAPERGRERGGGAELLYALGRLAQREPVQRRARRQQLGWGRDQDGRKLASWVVLPIDSNASGKCGTMHATATEEGILPMDDLERQYLSGAYELADDVIRTFQNHEVANMLDLDTSVSERVNQAAGIAEDLITRGFIEDARSSPRGVSRTDGPLRLTRAGIEEAQRLSDPVELRKEQRRRFLRSIYELAQGSPAEYVYWHDLAPEYGFAAMRYPPKPIIRIAEQLEGSGLIIIETEEARVFQITPEGVDEVEGNRREPQPSVTTTFNMSGTFYQAAVGTHNTNTFTGDLDFSRVERRIEEEGGADKEELRELVAEMRELLESGETLEKGRLARFNDKLKEYPWLAGPVAGWLLNFGTQEIAQHLPPHLG